MGVTHNDCDCGHIFYSGAVDAHSVEHFLFLVRHETLDFIKSTCPISSVFVVRRRNEVKSKYFLGSAGTQRFFLFPSPSLQHHHPHRLCVGCGQGLPDNGKPVSAVHQVMAAAKPQDDTITDTTSALS